MNSIGFSLDQYMAERKNLIDGYLKEHVRLPSEFVRLKEACEYALFPGGKRIRPILSLASCEAVGGDIASVMPFACAIELIHTYSLIHDDLPAIDNDELRRGKPTVHVAFGEAIAILAGDALLTEAFRLMSDVGLWEDVYHHEALEVINLIAQRAGARGMVGGQSLDVLWEGKEVDERTVWQIYEGKTASLIEAAVTTGAKLSGATSQELKNLNTYAHNIGLAFQIRDDILNETGDSRKLGKSTGTDRELSKPTLVRALGIDTGRKKLDELTQIAVSAIEDMGASADPLRAIADHLKRREI